ncbi:ABC transporter substrate-binding protein [Methylophilus sp. Leaf408]|uniref:ABC transporter substrate-binding protein n=1 Tax=Methylophilus sp. Leaf408 TaxID=2876561 RepID=UPI001E46F7DD|nr:ABC transporter substrate-binding protein [Methylophilus sp. Leaf408]
MIKKSITAIFSVALVCLATSVFAEEKPLRIGWVYAMANAPAVIADKKGFYAAEGLNVDLKSFNDGPLLQQAVAAGDLDVAYVGSPPVYHWFSRGLESKILAQVNYGQAAVIANQKSPVITVSDLRGKKLAGVAKGSGMDVLLRGYVLKEKARLDPDQDLSIINMPAGNMNAALEHNEVDAAFSWEPFVSQSLLRGSSKLVLDVNKELPQYPWYVVIALPKTLKSRPEEVTKLLRAHLKAIAFLQSNPEESNQIIAEAFKLETTQGANGKTIKPEEIVQEARKRMGWSARLDTKDLQFIQRLMDYSLSLGFINKPLKVEQVVDTSFLQRAEQSLSK